LTIFTLWISPTGSVSGCCMMPFATGLNLVYLLIEIHFQTFEAIRRPARWAPFTLNLVVLHALIEFDSTMCCRFTVRDTKLHAFFKNLLEMVVVVFIQLRKGINL
jgi:hypothetical protein